MKLNVWEKVCALLMLCLAMSIGSTAQTFTTLFSFDYANGEYPSGSLVQGFNGNLYGTTALGGNPGCLGGFTCGTIFEITPGGTITSLHSFDTSDGASPSGALVQVADGNFYGTTDAGGSCTDCGTVFEITAGGAFTSLYSFCVQVNCPDGSNPYSGLVQGNDGNLYGTTYSGGNSGNGTVFKITPTGTLTTLYSFCSQTNCTDGGQPYAGMVRGTNGNFYGTTPRGGVNGSGTVFTITPTGKLSTLYSFCAQAGCTDGASPAGMIQAADGNLYGTTTAGGRLQPPFCAKIGGCGTVFKITPAGKLTTLYRFCAQINCADGGYPGATLIQATDGNFYGTTGHGGIYASQCAAGCGTVFAISASGALTVLHSFCFVSSCADGASPGGLVQSTNGMLYGITGAGGTSTNCGSVTNPGCGTVYSLNMGLGPFVETNPTSGKPGWKITIFGGNLKQTTSVRFNGMAANFTVVSGTKITATVPTGATTGLVEVTTPTGTLSSNVAFNVIP